MKIKNIYEKFILPGLVLAIFVGIFHSGNAEVFAADVNVPTIQMGDNVPMTRDEFMEWRNQRGIRHFNFNERIYPAGIFFDWANGQAFGYGELNGGILHVFHRPGIASENRSISVQAIPDTSEINHGSKHFSPIIFTNPTPILYSDSELTAMIESVPHQNPLDTKSTITLDRRLTESEFTAWITEYGEMGGATAFELAVVREINRVRAQHGLHSLALDPALIMSARLKTQEFGDLQYFGHISPLYGSPTEMVLMFRFEGSGVSESITQAGSSRAPMFRTTPENTVGGMLASTRGHKEILLSPNVYSVGFGAFFSPNSTGRNGDMSHMFYFSAMFGFFD
jgi:uncharacterized protein YkwD